MPGVFTNLTVAVDDSPAASAGVNAALRYARDDAAIVACSVVDPNAPFPLSDIPFPPPPPSTADRRREARLTCAGALRAARERGLRGEDAVLEDHPASGILRCAREHHSDAIAIGSHGRAGLKRALLGSVAEEVVRESDVPVIVAHPGDDERVGPIAVAIDDSPASDAALTTAIDLAKPTGHTLVLLHVFGAGDLRRVEDGLREDVSERFAEARMQGEALLEDAAARCRSAGVACEPVMLQGDAAQELLAAVARHACSAIVIGTHGGSELSRLLFGSVAATVAEQARIPVVMVRKTG
jgi:nucleotide-binding universal stress UspA family protein